MKINNKYYLILRFFSQKIVEKSALGSDVCCERARLLDFSQLK